MMTSQILAIYYLNDLDHYIKEKLKCKYYIRYQDDFLIFDKSKERLKENIFDIRKFLNCEGLKLNPKSRIFKSTNDIIFIGKKLNGKSTKYFLKLKKIQNSYNLYSDIYNNREKTLYSFISGYINFKKVFCN